LCAQNEQVVDLGICLAVASVTAFSAQAQEVKGDAKAGETKIAMCIGCHGIQGYQATFPEVYKVPKISGQGAKYIASSLAAYKKGDRKHPTMRGIADSLSDQDMADVAAYYEQSGQTGAAAAAKASREPSTQVAELLKKGACVSCHGENFAKPIDPSYPKIAGQYGDYLYATLKAYKNDRPQHLGPCQRRDGRRGQAVLEQRAEGAGDLRRLAGRRPQDRAAVAFSLNARPDPVTGPLRRAFFRADSAFPSAKR
jgi:cytochrome c553